MAVVVWMAVGAAVASAGCAGVGPASMSDEQRKAYRVALDRMVRGYVYEMGCPALLPLAEDMLWESGFQNVEYARGDRGLSTQWRDDGDHRIQYELQAHEVGHDACAVQMVRRHQSGSTAQQQRDVDLELALLEYVDDDEATRLRDEAVQEAEQRGDGS